MVKPQLECGAGLTASPDRRPTIVDQDVDKQRIVSTGLDRKQALVFVPTDVGKDFAVHT